MTRSLRAKAARALGWLQRWGVVGRAILKSLRRLAPYLPDLRDLHVYGGGLLVALGISWLTRPGAGLMAFGALLLYLGLRRRAL